MMKKYLDKIGKLNKKSLIVFIVIIISFISIIVFLINKKLSYEQLENKMKQVAINYFEKNKKDLPPKGSSIIVPYDYLVEVAELKKSKEYLNESCTGRVVIKNNDNKYFYTPYLDCGKNYKTMEFYNKILADNQIVTEGSGLYIQSDFKVFRGNNINNFVKIGNKLWRIVKIDSDNSIKLVIYSGKYSTTYNKFEQTLDSLYNDKYFINKDIKEKLVSKPLCIGSRKEENNINNGSVECNKVTKNKYIGILSLYEYINSSMDIKCESAKTNECKNDNYLYETDENISWWLSTPTNEESNQNYYILSDGKIGFANNKVNLYVRPTIYLDSNVIYKSGSGTLTDPYIIR